VFGAATAWAGCIGDMLGVCKPYFCLIDES